MTFTNLWAPWWQTIGLGCCLLSGYRAGGYPAVVSKRLRRAEKRAGRPFSDPQATPHSPRSFFSAHEHANWTQAAWISAGMFAGPGYPLVGEKFQHVHPEIRNLNIPSSSECLVCCGLWTPVWIGHICLQKNWNSSMKARKENSVLTFRRRVPKVWISLCVRIASSLYGPPGWRFLTSPLVFSKELLHRQGSLRSLKQRLISQSYFISNR